MNKPQPQKHQPLPNLKHSFQSVLERIARGMEYYAVSIPKKVTDSLGTRGPVPVQVVVNNSEPFLASLYPVGEGRHFLRVKNKICKSLKIKEGDLVQVDVVVRDRLSEIFIPGDLCTALKLSDASQEFDNLPLGKKSFMLRSIAEAVKPETRAQRIRVAIDEVKKRK